MGYTGGTSPSPTYETVCAGDGHTEAIRIEYDPSQLTYEQLLGAFLNGHRPAPSKPQYKSAVWYHNEEQKQIAERLVIDAGKVNIDVDTDQTWYDAEDYHQKYYQKGCTVM